MKVYTLLTEDRHSEPTVDVYPTKDMAIQAAKDYLEKIDVDPSEIDDTKLYYNWIYYAVYSCEGDCVRVEGHTIDEN